MLSLYNKINKNKKIRKEKVDIIKLQKAGHCLTLFHKGGNAYDMWISKNFITHMIAYCHTLFPDAMYDEIQS